MRARVFFGVAGLAAILSLVVAMPTEAADLRYTIAVSQFENRAGYAAQWNMGDAWDTILTDLLNKSDHFLVLGETDMREQALAEQDFVAQGATAQGGKIAVSGQMTPAQILVKGAITSVQAPSGSGAGAVRVKGFKIGGRGGKAEVNITLYMVDSSTGQVLASESVVGTAKRKGASIGYWNPGWNASFGGDKNDNVGQAIADAAQKAVDYMIGQLPSIPWTGTVALVKSGKVFINRGAREGVSSGQAFVVGTVDVIRDPDTGEVLDESMNELARLVCGTVKEKLSVCDVSSGGGVKSGMAVHPVT